MENSEEIGFVSPEGARFLSPVQRTGELFALRVGESPEGARSLSPVQRTGEPFNFQFSILNSSLMSTPLLRGSFRVRNTQWGLRRR